MSHIAASLRAAAALCLAAALAAEEPAPAGAAAALPLQLYTEEAASRHGMVVAGCPEAARAGAAVLEAGGNAVDAAVAAAFALGVAEPGQSGLGGQTYMLVRMADGRAVALDGSCAVPLRAARAELQQLRATGRLYGYPLVAAPTTLATLAHALSRWGTMTLAEALQPALEIADAGAPFTPNQLLFLSAYVGKVRSHPYLAGLLLDDRGNVSGLERTYCNLDLAATLRRIAAGGTTAFYRGAIAAEIEADMVAGGGYVRIDDLVRVRPVEREPVRGCYRGLEVVSFPFPGGGTPLLEALAILDRFPGERLRRVSADAVQLQLEATRLALADESTVRYAAPEASRALLAAANVARRAARISDTRALTRTELGEDRLSFWLERDTTHLSVVDRHGNAVSLTQTLGHGFGACVATPGLGFAYNCMLEAFDYEQPASRAYLRPFAVPFTAMAPTLLLRDGRLAWVLGGVGSARIPSSMVIAVVNLVDRELPLRDAIAAPRALWGGNQENTVWVEIAGELTEALAATLKDRGYANVTLRRFPLAQGELGWQGGTNAIAVAADGTLLGVGDPRRQGAAVGAAPVPQRPRVDR